MTIHKKPTSQRRTRDEHTGVEAAGSPRSAHPDVEPDSNISPAFTLIRTAGGHRHHCVLAALLLPALAGQRVRPLGPMCKQLRQLHLPGRCMPATIMIGWCPTGSTSKPLGQRLQGRPLNHQLLDLRLGLHQRDHRRDSQGTLAVLRKSGSLSLPSDQSLWPMAAKALPGHQFGVECGHERWL